MFTKRSMLLILITVVFFVTYRCKPKDDPGSKSKILVWLTHELNYRVAVKECPNKDFTVTPFWVLGTFQAFTGGSPNVVHLIKYASHGHPFKATKICRPKNFETHKS